MSTPVNHLGGKCPCIPFFIGGQMSEGGNILPNFIFLNCPPGSCVTTPVYMIIKLSYHQSTL